MHTYVCFVFIFLYIGFITVFIGTHVRTAFDVDVNIHFFYKLLAPVTVHWVRIMTPLV